MCAEAVLLAYVSADHCRLAMWHTLLLQGSGSGSACRADVLRAAPAFLPRKITVSSVTTGKQGLPHLTSHTKSSTEHQQNPFPSSGVIWRGWCQRPDTRRDGPVVCTVPVPLFNTALFVLSALCLSPVQPGRAGEGSQQHKDWIESC